MELSKGQGQRQNTKKRTSSAQVCLAPFHCWTSSVVRNFKLLLPCAVIVTDYPFWDRKPSLPFLYCTSFSPLSYYLFNFFVDFWRYFFIYLLWWCLFCSYSASLLHLLTQKQTIVHLAQYPVWFIPHSSTQWLIHGGRKTMLATVSLRVIFQINWS